MGDYGTPGFRRSWVKKDAEQMFLGQFEHNVDDKGRLTIPSRFRELLVGGAYVTQGFDQNLMVLTNSHFDKIYQHVNEMSITDPTARLLKRLIFASAGRIEVDKAGRILLPQFLRQFALLDSQVMIVGVGDFFEIWSPNLWAKQVQQIQDIDANAQRFAALDLSSH